MAEQTPFQRAGILPTPAERRRGPGFYPVSRHVLRHQSPLPRERRRSRTILIGRPGFMHPLEEFSYDALVLSESHHRLPGGAWSGGGPFYAVHNSQEHQGVLHLPYSAYGVEGPWVIAGVHAGFDGLPPGWNDSQLGSRPWIEWPLLRGPLEDLYSRGYRRARPGQPVADLGVFLSELRGEGLPSIPLVGQALRGAGIRLLGGSGHFPSLREAARQLVNQIRGFVSLTASGRGARRRVLRDIGDATLGTGGFLDLNDAAWKRASRKAGSEYLNLEFGWKPFLRDLRALHGLSKEIGRYLEQLQHDNGAWRHRRVTLNKDTGHVVTREVNNGPPYFALSEGPPSFPISGTTYHRVTRTTQTHTWWEGSFRYWIDEPRLGGSDWLWEARAVAALYGVFPTPQLVWNATPWSWLVDWFVDLDTVLANLSPNAVDNLVLRHGYIMQHVTVTTRAVSVVRHDASPVGSGHHWPAVNHTFQSVYRTERKTRLGSIPPFGHWGGTSASGTLTPRRLAILASLGLSRA